MNAAVSGGVSPHLVIEDFGPAVERAVAAVAMPPEDAF